jgi:transcriptional regulator with XRE-family HTH domain
VNNKYNPEFCKAFGKRVREIREQKGLGMREFALQADIEYSQLSKIELGSGNPTISTVLALAESLGISHQELFNFKFPTKPKK